MKSPFRFILPLLLLGLSGLATAASSAADSLRAASFVNQFLISDANPSEVFINRRAYLPRDSITPSSDCLLFGIVDAIQQDGEPQRIEGTKAEFLVPVVAKLLFFWAGCGGGEKAQAKPGSSDRCAFEYERWNEATGRFEADPLFRSKKFNEYFRTWGNYLEDWMPPTTEEGRTASIVVQIKPEFQWVRYFVHVGIKNDKVIRLDPQTPRHWLVPDAIKKLEWFRKYLKESIQNGVSDREFNATGEALKTDIERMKRQLQIAEWQLQILQHRQRSLN